MAFRSALAGTVSNAGTIAATATAGSYFGVDIQGAGTVGNVGTASLIEGMGGVSIVLGGTVSNAGTIAATATAGSYFGVDIQGAGTVGNVGTASLIEGLGGVSIALGGTVSNAGTIAALPGAGTAVIVQGGGYVGNIGAASLIEGWGGVSIGAAGSVGNAGTIDATASGGSYFGVDIQGAGIVGNSGTASLIAGYSGGVYVGQAASVSNAGTIELNQTASDGSTFGVLLGDGGTVVNGAANVASALLYSAVAVYGRNASTTVVNFGTIASGAPDGFGVELTAGGTVVDSGTIGGSTAIYFGGAGSDLLVLQSRYAITGGIAAAGAGNTLELLGSVTAAVTANYTSLGLSGFQTVAFAPGTGAYATLTIANDSALPGTIAGFVGVGDTIDLTALSDAGNDAVASFDSLTDTLTITADGGTSVGLQLDSENYAGITWAAENDGSNGTAVTIQPSAPANVPPAIGAPPAYQGVAAGGSDQPFATVTITDPSFGATDTVTASLADPASGALSDIAGGSFDPTTGVYTVSGTPAQVNSDLADLVYVPSAPSGGYLGTAVLDIGVAGPGGSVGASTSITAVTQVLGARRDSNRRHRGIGQSGRYRAGRRGRRHDQ